MTLIESLPAAQIAALNNRLRVKSKAPPLIKMPLHAWDRRSLELVKWAMPLANRKDVWGGYLPKALREADKKTVTKPAQSQRGILTLTEGVLKRHFSARSEGDVIGLHTTGPDDTARFIVIDVDRHSPTVDPLANCRYAMHIFERLQMLGFRSVFVEDSDGQGGYHIWLIFNQPIESDLAHRFAKHLSADYATHGIATAPECYPKQSNLKGMQYGSWIRLPGRHHTRNHWSRVWDGSAWQSDDAAIDIIVRATGDDPSLIPSDIPTPLHAPSVRSVAPLPAEAIQIEEGARLKLCKQYVDRLPDSVAGQRGHDALFAVAMACVKFGLSRESARLILAHYNDHRAIPPWSEAELSHKLDDAYKNTHEFGMKLSESTREVALDARRKLPSDIGNAARFVKMHGREWRWVPEYKKFIRYTNGKWEIDTSGAFLEAAKQVALSISDETKTEPDDAVRDKLLKWAWASHKSERLKAMLELAKPDLAFSADRLDADPWLLNVQNGTIDLRSGELRPHRAEDYITRMCPVAFDPTADCPRFRAFMLQIFAGNEVVVAFMQRVIGYMLTGDTRERCAFFNVGSGANGKTTLFAIIVALMGGYASHIQASALAVKNNDSGVPHDFARLKGARLVVAQEFEEGKPLAEASLKLLTSGEDLVTVRFLYGEFFDYRPTFKIVLATNHRPEIRGADDAIWDRVRLIPFTERFYDDAAEAERECGNPARVKDKTLIEKLKQELPGILAWAVQGCLAWQHQGLAAPSEISEATQSYRSDSDRLSGFIADRCEIDDRAAEDATPLYHTYRDWAIGMGDEPLTQKAFGTALTNKGFPSIKCGTVKRRGLKLRFDMSSTGVRYYGGNRRLI